MIQPILRTSNLTLRPYNQEDAARVAELAGDYDVVKTTQNIPHPYTIEMAIEWIGTHEQGLSDGSHIAYAIDSTAHQGLVGTVSLINIANRQASLGYWIGKPFWGQGICSEAVSGILQFSFNDLDLSRVYADHYASNPASGKVMRKNGMQFVGEREDLDRDGNPITICRYEILKSVSNLA